MAARSSPLGSSGRDRWNVVEEEGPAGHAASIFKAPIGDLAVTIADTKRELGVTAAERTGRLLVHGAKSG